MTAKSRPNRTIADAIVDVMREKERPLSPAEAYGAVVERQLYRFNSDDPVSVVRTTIRRRCLGLDFPSALPKKLFKPTNDGRYTLNLAAPSQAPEEPQTTSVFQQLIDLQQRHEAQVRARVLEALKALPPRTFELFAERLLKAYGFEDLVVTGKSRDGGIDGHGRLPIGLTSVSVAFQCKRYTDKAVGREAIDTFRGAVSGLHEQGYFFATSRFTAEAVDAQRRPGAVPIALFDGEKIVDIMFSKEFGVAFRDMRVPELALDVILEQG
jgi:restriction system protein